MSCAAIIDTPVTTMRASATAPGAEVPLSKSATPLQGALMPADVDLASIFFLPHGVRVLAFFFFG